jgi:RIO-like serine/threonine protein kinase
MLVILWIIDKIETVIFNKLNVNFSNPSDDVSMVLDTYKNFYRKIALRHKDLSRINIFTTSNDLFSEIVLDSLNIHY